MQSNKRGLFFRDDFKEQYYIGDYRSMFDEDRGYVVIEPYPTANELKEYYEGSYFEEGDLVPHDYLNDELIYRATYLGYIKKIFPFIKTKSNVEVLEYGCGVGNFVRSLLVCDENPRIGNIDGVDLSDTAIALAGKHTESERASFYTLDERNLQKKYDLIAMLEVVEHIPDVQNIIKELSLNVEVGGILFITTPNYNSFEQRVFKESWRLFCPPEHINFFTEKTLSQMLTDSGWEILKVDDQFIFSFTIGLRKKLSGVVPFFFIRMISWVKKILVYSIFNSALRLLGFEGGKITLIARKL